MELEPRLLFECDIHHICQVRKILKSFLLITSMAKIEDEEEKEEIEETFQTAISALEERQERKKLI